MAQDHFETPPDPKRAIQTPKSPKKSRPCFLVLGLLNSKILNPLNKLWFKFGIFLGKIISPLVMGIIFFLVVTPIGLLMRLLNKDLLNLRFNNNSSYWIKRTTKNTIPKLLLEPILISSI